MDADAVDRSLQLGSAFAGRVQPDKVSEYLKEQRHKLDIISDLTEFKQPRADKPKGVDVAVKLYHALDDANIL